LVAKDIGMLISEPSSLNEASHTWDVAIVGAGPAGSMAAHALARCGLAVLLVDRAAFPRWKVCGACLNPYTLAMLANAGLGERVSACGAVPVRQMRLAARRREADIALSGWQVLSRARLDTVLVEASVAAGACFLSRTQAALGPELPHGRVIILRQQDRRQEIMARLVLAADGLGGRLLSGESGCHAYGAPGSRIGAGVIAETGPRFYREGVIYMAYGLDSYVGLVRQEDGRLNLAAAFGASALRTRRNPGAVAAQLLGEAGWPAIAGLSALRWHGTMALTRQSVPSAGRVLAVGDAAGYVEPFTGEGIGWALASATAVVPLALRAVERWQPGLADEWAALGHHDHARRRRLCRAMAWVSRHPAIARGLIGVVGRFPWLAAPLVSRICK
jgi:flavin-dependent dehydrogenase